MAARVTAAFRNKTLALQANLSLMGLVCGKAKPMSSILKRRTTLGKMHKTNHYFEVFL